MSKSNKENDKENIEKIIKLTNSKFFSNWDEMFKRLVEYKQKTGRTTISKQHHDKELYRWYRHLKKITIRNDVELPVFYKKQLDTINFHFGDGHNERQSKINESWLALLQNAIDEGIDIQANHRFKYKGKNLGTWLVGIAQKNKEGKLLELTQRMKEMGFDMEAKNKKPENVVRRFISDLLEDETPHKGIYQTRFNQYILHKKDKLKPYLIQAVNDVWRYKFNEERSWEINDFVHQWKKIRYSVDNTEGKWIIDKSKMGRIYTYAIKRKKDPEKMKEIIHHFTEKELAELKAEGFTVNFNK